MQATGGYADLGTKADLYKLFRSFADRGGAVLWHSTDETEFAQCDRTVVMRDGRVTGELARGAATPEAVMALATGEAAA